MHAGEQRFLRAGASDFIHSPFIPEELKCRIDNNVETIRQLDALRRQAASDPLTGIANRRYFFEEGQRQLENCRRLGRPGSAALLDIDFFKQVNDLHGHAAGDHVLAEVARILSRKAAAAGHLAARDGGEEFCLFLSDMDLPAAQAFCEELRQSIEAMVIVHQGKLIKVTISAGVCPIEPTMSFDTLLQQADAYLYDAKRQGRNCVISPLSARVRPAAIAAA